MSHMKTAIIRKAFLDEGSAFEAIKLEQNVSVSVHGILVGQIRIL